MIITFGLPALSAGVNQRPRSKGTFIVWKYAGETQ
jgi:hypothetical protein